MPTDRVQCAAALLLGLALAVPSFAARADTAASGWSRHDEIDTLNGSPVPTAVLPAREGAIGHLDAPSTPRKPILVVRCRQHELQVFVLFDQPVAKAADRPVRTLWQAGGAKPVATLSPVSPDGSAFGAFSTRDSRPILDAVAASDGLTVQMESERGETASGRFDLAGTAAAIGPVRDACR